jgi:hypothetical protein
MVRWGGGGINIEANLFSSGWKNGIFFFLFLSASLVRCLHSVLSRDESLWPLPLLRAATPPPPPPDGQQCRRVMNVHAEWPPVETLCMQKLFVDIVTENGCFVDIMTQNGCFVTNERLRYKSDDVVWILRTHLYDCGKWEIRVLGFSDFCFVL